MFLLGFFFFAYFAEKEPSVVREWQGHVITDVQSLLGKFSRTCSLRLLRMPLVTPCLQVWNWNLKHSVTILL